MNDLFKLLYFLWAELCAEDWSNEMRPIVKKYGCIMNALERYHLVWAYDIVEKLGERAQYERFAREYDAARRNDN